MCKLRNALKNRVSPEQLFMLSVLVVNGGNYFYNLILGRLLGPDLFADAAVLITFLLVLSFIAMTYQIATAKYIVILENSTYRSFIHFMYKYSTGFGVLLGLAIILGAQYLQSLFNTSTSSMFTLFGIGVPIYFMMSVNRGFYQGKKDFTNLSVTYQTEMISRLLITLILVWFFEIKSPWVIAFGIICSFFFGLIPMKKDQIQTVFKKQKEFHIDKNMKKFFVITAFYELTQIVINNSDILMVKHYFESYEAGLYASLALIGRIVYFIAWLFVMLLLPKVVSLKKAGENTSKVLFKYVCYIAVIASVITLGCALFPELAISLLFGDQYLSMAPLLWKYALATGIFAVSNIFAYYYLSLDDYLPVVISGFFGLIQLALISFFHNNLEEVVFVQIISMIFLFLFQIGYFMYDYGMKSKLNKS